MPTQFSDEAEAQLNQFIAQHKVISVKRSVIKTNQPHWAFCVEYIAGQYAPNQPSPKIDYREYFSDDDDFKTYVSLRELRKGLAQEASVPPYAVFNNAQLAAFVERRVITRETMAKIDGVGESRLQKWSEHFLPVLKQLFAEAE